MKIVVATGCPHSGWEMVLPVLQQAGLAAAGDSFTRWHDELFQAAGVDEPLRVLQALQPGPGLGKSADALLPTASQAPLLLADSRSLWVLDFWAARLPKAQFLLFYAPAETSLAHAILRGVDPRKYLEGWQAAGREMLRFQRRNRRRALLLDAGAALREPQALTNVCGLSGLEAQTPQPGPVQVFTLPAMERLVAGYLAAAEPAVLALQAELEASAQPLGDGAPPVHLQPEALFNDYLQRRQQLEQAGQAREKLEATHKETVQESEFLLLQLHQVQEEFEATFLQKQQLEQDKAVHAKLADDARQAQERLEAANKAAAKENEVLMLRLHQVQEQLEATLQRRKQLEQENTSQRRQLNQAGEELKILSSKNQKLEREIEEQRQRVARLKKTASWKITAPVRALAKPFNQENKKQKKKEQETQEQVLLLKASGLFDEAWYRSEYADVAGNGIDPVEHYLLHGAAEGRNPSPQFNTRGYLKTNQDVAATGINPLLHYVQFGKAEGRKGF